MEPVAPPKGIKGRERPGCEGRMHAAARFFNEKVLSGQFEDVAVHQVDNAEHIKQPTAPRRRQLLQFDDQQLIELQRQRDRDEQEDPHRKQMQHERRATHRDRDCDQRAECRHRPEPRRIEGDGDT